MLNIVIQMKCFYDFIDHVITCKTDVSGFKIKNIYAHFTRSKTQFSKLLCHIFLAHWGIQNPTCSTLGIMELDQNIPLSHDL